MRKLSKIGHELWLKTELGAPPFIQKTIIHPLLARKESLRLALKPFLEVYRVEGNNQAGPLTMTYIGIKTSIRTLQKYLFVGDSTRTSLGRLPVWQLQKMNTLPESDLVVVEAGKQLIAQLPRQKAIVMPPYVHFVLDIRGSWDEVKKHFRESVRSEFRLTRKYGYTFRVSYDRADFEQFYQNMYLPTMRQRHGKFVSAMSKSDAAAYFKHGFLFLVEREGRCVAGSLCYPQQKMISFILLGVLNAEGTLIKEGVLGAMNVLRLEWANQQGYETANFLGSDPYLESGTFQFKRKWGATVMVPEYENKRLWLQFSRNTPAVTQFLKDNPAIIINEKGALQGFMVTDNLTQIKAEERMDWQKKYATPGLENLLVYRVADLMADTPYETGPGPVSIWNAQINPV